jgi:C4-dicarboxylate transporter/malic acid transport protein
MIDPTGDRGAGLAAGGAGAPEAPPLARLRGFHPGWFGAVMGTAIIAVAASMNPGDLSELADPFRHLAQVMAILAAALAVALGVPYVLRWFRHPDASLRDLRDPVAGALYGTFPGGILVLAATAAAVGPSLIPAGSVRTLVAALAWVGVPLAFVISVLFAYQLFVGSELAHETINGGWFIPPVVNIVVPMVLLPLVPGSSPATARLLVMGSYLFFGMGFLLYLLIVTTLHHRLVAHPLFSSSLAPSLWIGLGPIGVGAITLVKMAAAGTVVFGTADRPVETLSLLAATALWGFGIWWLAAAVVLLVRFLRRGPIPWSLGWWGFTFPLGAFTVATLTLARGWHISLLEWAGALLAALLGLFWLVVAGRTAWAMTTGEAWRPALPAPGALASGADGAGVHQHVAAATERPSGPPHTDGRGRDDATPQRRATGS